MGVGVGGGGPGGVGGRGNFWKILGPFYKIFLISFNIVFMVHRLFFTFNF
jgi:hypothetical protein